MVTVSYRERVGTRQTTARWRSVPGSVPDGVPDLRCAWLRLRTAQADVLLRVFCHATGERVILLLGGYDKGGEPSPRRQAREIEVARRRLADYRRRNP